VADRGSRGGNPKSAHIKIPGAPDSAYAKARRDHGRACRIVLIVAE
jgi:hypothetical protein